MSHRYKIFEVCASGPGPVPRAAHVIPTTCSIGELLEKEIGNLGGATEFGGESPAFAWLVSARSHHLVFRDDDSNFNIAGIGLSHDQRKAGAVVQDRLLGSLHQVSTGPKQECRQKRLIRLRSRLNNSSHASLLPSKMNQFPNLR